MGDGHLSKHPLGFIKQCILAGKILWTYHVNMRMKDRFISRQMIIESAESFEIIEEYPKDKYFPSYLVYARHGKTVLHILVGVDVYNENVRIITAYHPNKEQWGEDFKRRKV